MLLGLDVGGTFTDAVIIDAHRVVATAKRRTTKDNLMNGIGEALDAVLEGYDTSNIEQVTLSTTVVTNTIVEAKEQVVDLYVITGPGRNVDDIFPVEPIYLQGYTCLLYTSMPHKSDVQVALISGGTSGIGFATAKLLLKEGWCVVINGRNEKVGQKAKTKLRRYSSKVQYIQGDVSKIEDCQRIVKETVDLFGGVSALVTAAGYYEEELLLSLIHI